MTGVMAMLKDIIDNKPYYSFVDSARREKARIAFDKGLSCILKCQIIDNGTLTAWCQQHNEVNFSPAWRGRMSRRVFVVEKRPDCSFVNEHR